MKPFKLCLCCVFPVAIAAYVAVGSAAEPLAGAAAKLKMEAARDEVANLRSNIFLTLLQLDRVRGERDPAHPQFQVFTNQLARMEELAAAFGQHAQEMKQNGEAYFADWETRTAAIPDPAVRKRAEQRYGERKECYEAIKEFMQDAKANFLPFVADLKRIKTVLETGWDKNSVATAKRLFMSANWRCIDTQRALLNIEDQLN